MNKFKLFMLIMAMMFVAVFILSCSSDDNGEDGGEKVPEFTKDQQTYYWDMENVKNTDDCEKFNGSGTLKVAIVSEDRHDTTYMDAGTIENGILNLNFPETIPDKYLHPYCEAEIDYCKAMVYDTFRSFYDMRLFLEADENVYGIVLGSDNEKNGYRIREIVGYMYSSQAIKTEMTGYNKGWSPHYLHEEGSEETGFWTETTTNNILETDVKWLVIPKPKL